MKISMPRLLAVVLMVFISSIFSTHSIDVAISENQFITDNETLVSKNGIFVLGFFSRGGKGSSSKTKYLGLWYNFSTDVVVWVANRENPVTKSFGALQLAVDGNLVISQSQTSSINSTDVVWSSNSSNPTGNTKIVNPIAKLSDSGNLVITNGADGSLLWESFDYPTDTLLPGMKLGFNKITGHQRYLIAWKQSSDPSPGNILYKMGTSGLKEIYSTINGQKQMRIGPWNGKWFVGFPRMTVDLDGQYKFVDNQIEAFFSYNMINTGSYGRITIFHNYTFIREVWRSDTSKSIWSAETDECDRYSYCGPNVACNTQELILCQCYHGFHPKSDTSWSSRDYTLGCERNQKLNCSGEEGFLLMKNLKTPDTTNSTFDRNMGLDDCRVECINNCSCVAYAPLYMSDRIPRGCIMWHGDLLDTKLFTQDYDGEDLYLRLPNSELPNNSSNKTTIIAIVVPGLIILSLFGIYIWFWKKKRKSQRGQTGDEDSRKWNDELPLFDFSTIDLATNNFSSDNKIGQGGFGVVYKGTMADGQEIAVKRLSKSSSGQGLDEFMNESMLIVKLQHRNLVRLLGCCREGDERILVYEFMKNKSLDNIIFGENRNMLDWQKRVEIIIGISRGLLYLHQDSRLRIIHRDLKAGNVLLDDTMNPKISDFGTARLFSANQHEENTRRVIGTFGYMSPEYLNSGIFSMKSDVFSFGVLLLEIINGKKNRVCYHYEPNVSLLEQAWTLCKDGNAMELLDDGLIYACSQPQVIRFIQIGLLCVQECAVDRPSMSDVFIMLSKENSSILESKRPAFCKGSFNDSMFEQVNHTNTVVTFTKMEVR